MLDRDPKTQAIFDAENNQGDDFDRDEQCMIPGGKRRHRFERNCGETDRNQKNDHAIDETTPPIADRASFQQLVKAMPPSAKRFADHHVRFAITSHASV
jgi:hypothetical protein